MIQLVRVLALGSISNPHHHIKSQARSCVPVRLENIDPNSQYTSRPASLSKILAMSGALGDPVSK